MENTFNFFIKNFTTLVGGKYAGYYTLGITLSIILVFICQLIYSVVKNKKSNFSYTKFAFFTAILTLLVSISEYYTTKKVFTSVYYSVIFTLFNLTLSLIFSFVLNTVDTVIESKKKVNIKVQEEQTNDYSSQKLQVSDNTKKAIMRLKSQPADLYNLENISNEFIDVQYIKSLIDSLKSKSLSVKESQELEEFEVFLLNFCYRQPTASEKEKLSIYLSSLMKKLAFYKIVD